MMVPTEEAEQRALCLWLDRAWPEIRYHSIPNGGWRNKATAVKLKATGVKPGVPDLFIAEPRGGYHGFYLELKRVKGGVLSPCQKEWLEALASRGYKAVSCAGARAASVIIVKYLRS